MQKSFRLIDLDCANCAAKMERGINKIKGVNSCSINFMMQKMIIDINDDIFDSIMDEVEKYIKKVEPDCKVKR